MKNLNFHLLLLVVISFCLVNCTKSNLTPEKLSVGFSADTQIVVEGEQITFTDESTGFPDSYEWTFEGGDPATSTEQNPTVRFNKAGKFKVSLSIRGAAGRGYVGSVTYCEIEVVEP